jgi:hypothetical protein
MFACSSELTYLRPYTPSAPCPRPDMTPRPTMNKASIISDMSTCTPAEGRKYLQKAIQFIAGLLVFAGITLTAYDTEAYKLTNTILTAAVAALNLFISIILSNIALATGTIIPTDAALDDLVAPASSVALVAGAFANLATQTGFTPGPGYKKVRGIF